MMVEPTIGIIGGTGPQGRGLAMRLARAGYPVRVGSREAARADAIARELNDRAGTASIGGAVNAEVVAESRFVLLTVPFESAGETLRGLNGEFREGSVLVDVTVPLLFGKGGPTLAPLPEGSASGHLRSILPGRIPLVGCFKTLPAHLLEHIDTPLECDTFVFGDSAAAKMEWMEIVRGIRTLRPVDAGDLASAPFVEGMTALVIRINRAMKSKEGRFRVIGVGA